MKHDAKTLTSDIMTVCSVVAEEALKLAGVSQLDIQRLFLNNTTFSGVRLTKSRELAQKILGIKPAKKARKK